MVGKTLLAITSIPPRAMMGIDSCGILLSAIPKEEGEEKRNLIMFDRRIPAGAKLYECSRPETSSYVTREALLLHIEGLILFHRPP